MCVLDYFKSDARIITLGGMPLVGTILDNANLKEAFNKLPIAVAHPLNKYSAADICYAAIGLLTASDFHFEDTREYEGDPDFYGDALGIVKFPSSECLRQRLNQMGEGKEEVFVFHPFITQMNVDLLKANGITFTPNKEGYVYLDIDVTPYDESKSNKEGVSRTYKGFFGYSPIKAYLGNDVAFPINIELRDGCQHCQKRTPEFLIESIDIANQLTSNKILVRLDSGNDAAVNMGIIMDRGHFFVTKRNLRSEKKEEWLGLAKERVTPVQLREGKNLYIGSTWKDITYTNMHGVKETKNIRIVFEITETTIDKDGQYLCVPEIEVNTYWTNTAYKDEHLIELYHDHATSEQYHSEFKSDMDIEKLPSGKKKTNAVILDLAMLAFNVLRIIGCKMDGIAVPMRREDVKRRRIKTLIKYIIKAPIRVISHGGRKRYDLGGSNPWAGAIIHAAKAVAAV